MKNMKKLISLSTVFALLLSGVVSAQQSKSLLTPKDSLFMFVHKNESKVLMHPVKKGQTLFSISQFYGIAEAELMAYNPWFKDAVTQLSPGDKINIPIPNKAINRYVKSNKLKGYTPLFYIVQVGDNLFNISKNYMGMTVAEVKTRNKLKSENITPGQLLLVGWVPITGIPKTWREGASTPVAAPDTQVAKGGGTAPKSYSAIWVKDKNAVAGNFCLTNEAKKGAVISVTNLATKKTVDVTVVGALSSTKAKTVQFVLSEQAAIAIGLTAKENQVTIVKK
jgi:LysM repeat protein